MKVQVLVAAMNQYDHSLLNKMNINSDVIVGNQCNMNSVEQFQYKNNQVIYLNFNEVGVGLNRNNALMRATGDICLLADDDMRYVEGYTKIVEKAFLDYPKADVIIFNLTEKMTSRYIIKKAQRIWYFNYLRYGAARIAVKLQSVKKRGIYFNQCFGGGTQYCHGEDNIFLKNCIKAGLKIYAVPITIAELLNERKSTWNHGFDEKYLRDQGALYRVISKKWWRVLCVQDAIRRHKRDYKLTYRKAYGLMIKGGKEVFHN